jgi:UDP-glucose 4-epimerase
MNILITGVLGHIGSGLIKEIKNIKKLKKLYLIDSLKSNNINVLFNLNLPNIKVVFIQADILDIKSLNLINDKIHYVIHLASITNAAASFKIKNELFKNNYGIFKNVLGFCIRKKAKLIHLSSTSVYGLQSELVDESLTKLAPQSPYAEVKILEEKLLNKNKGKINFVTLRLGTITGISKGMRFHTAVNKFCLNTILRQKIPVWGDALNLHRPYLSLSDAIKTIIFFVNKNKFNNEIYNVVTNNYTVKNVLNFIKKNNFKTKVKITKSPILNQFSYKVSRKKLDSTGVKIGKSIDKDVKATLNLLKNLY